MSAPISSPDSDETEGSILRHFVDENIAQEQTASSPRSELLSHTSRRHDKIPTTKGHQVSRRRQSRRHRSDRELAYAEASPDELLSLLIDQEHESRRLRRALLTAADRIGIESRRAADVDRVNSDVVDRFKIVNDGRLAAQRDALKASQELRLYQFQLQTAQTEITRAQEALRVVQTQRDDAEMAAARAREKAHRLHQERLVAAAREEGRKYGFEAGFKRAHEEHGFIMRLPNQRRSRKSGRIRAERHEQVHPPVEDVHIVQQPYREVADDIVGLLSPISSPSRLPLRGLAETNSPEVVRVDRPPPASHPPAQRPPPPPEVSRPAPPPVPIPVTQSTPSNPLGHSPSIPLQIYKLNIPPADEIEQQFGRNEIMPKSTQPWVTANERLEMSDQQQQQMLQEQFEGIFQPPGADLSRGMSQQATSSSGKRKESWYTILRRKTFGRKTKQQVPNGAATTGPPVDGSETSQSWYMRKPPVHVRDFAIPVPRPRSSLDSGSVSTRVSQLDIVSTPNGSVSGRSGRSKLGGGLARRFKQNLHVIREDPMSRETTPVTENFGHRQSRSVDTPLEAGSSSYSDPRAVDEWRKSSASTPRTTSLASLGRPPTYIRRPAKLTVPERLAPDSGMPRSSRERIIWDNTGTSSPSRPPRSNRSSLRVVNVDEPEISPGIGITVQPPSRSPTDAVITPSESQYGNGYLSPNHAHQSLPSQNLHSTPSFSPVGHPPADPLTPTNQSQSRPPSRGYAPSVRSLRTQNQGDLRPNSPYASTNNQLAPKSPRRMSQPLPQDQPVPSRAQSRAGTATPRMPSVDVKMTPHSVRNHSLLSPTNGNGNLGLSHVASNTSLRSAGSYTRFDPKSYLDPAFYPAEDSAAANGNASDAARARSPAPRSRAHSRAASTSSSLEYV